MATAIPSTRSGQVWEHAIRDQEDFKRHVDYIHFNPVKHSYVQRVADWPFSSFHRYVRLDILPVNWAGMDCVNSILIWNRLVSLSFYPSCAEKLQLLEGSKPKPVGVCNPCDSGESLFLRKLFWASLPNKRQKLRDR